MEFGVFLPISGRAAGRETLMQAGRQAESLGFRGVWSADRIVIPWEIRTPYPYSADQQFIVPPDRPFLEPLTCLSFLAACTEKVSLGMSVLVLPYRPPLYAAKVVTTIDHLSRGRMVLGIGAGWMAEEFEALGVAFAERGRMTDEQVTLFRTLWSEERPRFEGRYYQVENVAFRPKPYGRDRIPIWVGGEGARAQRRAGQLGDAWFPYFVRITPAELAARFDNVRQAAGQAGREPGEVALNCCLPIEVTERPVAQEQDRLAGTPEQLVEAVRHYERIGVEHLALQFMVPRWPQRVEQIERFAREVMPAFEGR